MTCMCCDGLVEGKGAWCTVNCTISYVSDLTFHCAEHVKNIEVRITT